jgi:hypothetical protein
MKAVYKIGDFNGVSRGVPAHPGEADSLEQQEIKTIDDLWHCVGVNFDQGISTIATKAAVAPELIYALLIADGLGDSRHRAEEEPFKVLSLPNRSWLSLKRFWYDRNRHRLEAFLGIATLLLVALAIRAGYVSNKMTEQVVVKPSMRLLPFQSIRAEDVMLKGIPEEEGSFTSLDKVVGRFPLRAVAPGATLQEAQLIAEDLTGAMRDRRVLSIPVNPRTLSSTLTTPTYVWLLLSPRATVEKGPASTQSALLKDVILLSVNKQGDGAAVEVAVTDDGLKMIEPLLGEAEAFVLLPVGSRP